VAGVIHNEGSLERRGKDRVFGEKIAVLKTLSRREAIQNQIEAKTSRGVKKTSNIKTKIEDQPTVKSHRGFMEGRAG
jgi:hypothetical protein